MTTMSKYDSRDESKVRIDKLIVVLEGLFAGETIVKDIRMSGDSIVVITVDKDGKSEPYFFPEDIEEDGNAIGWNIYEDYYWD
tara:strand:+ start:1407 stop:1655 length:249 start_codon:yes stop_codon:yes gene_type:complete